MLEEICGFIEAPGMTWNNHPDPAELAALEDIQREGWFETDEPVIVSLLELGEAVSAVSDSEDEVIATVAHMLASGSVVLATDSQGLSGRLN